VVTATAALGERPDFGADVDLASPPPDDACRSGMIFGAASPPSAASEIAVTNVYRNTGFTGAIRAPASTGCGFAFQTPRRFLMALAIKTAAGSRTLRC
jgi:hypothetical protein